VVDKEATNKRRQDLPKTLQAGMKDIARAIELGPPSAELYFDAACLHGLAANGDPTQKAAALKHVREAVRRGIDPARLADACLDSVKGAELQQLAQTPPPAEAPVPATRIVNPTK